jgi:hypothetical protein
MGDNQHSRLTALLRDPANSRAPPPLDERKYEKTYHNLAAAIAAGIENWEKWPAVTKKG